MAPRGPNDRAPTTVSWRSSTRGVRLRSGATASPSPPPLFFRRRVEGLQLHVP